MKYSLFGPTLIFRLSLLHLILFSCQIQGREMPCNTGNFALPVSQQPGPLIGFGENIIDRNQVQLFLFGDAFLGQKKHFIDLIPSILYGITKDFSVFFNVPVAASYQADGHRSSGLEDIFLQFEYAVYTKQSDCSSDQVTVVVNASFPTGSSHKNPPTGFGSMGYFIGTTYNRTWEKWFCFTSYGAQLTTSHHGTRFGNQYLYQAGFGRDFANAYGWLFAWMVEIDGTFAKRNKINGTIDPNSGGNAVYLNPSFWASSKKWIMQLGLGYAVQQNLFGAQTRDGYLLAFNIGRGI